jgi:hypothetical protein
LGLAQVDSGDLGAKRRGERFDRQGHGRMSALD